MLRIAGHLIASLAGVGALSGLVLGLSGRSGDDSATVLAVPGCGPVSVAYGLLGGSGALSVRAEECRTPGATALWTEHASFAVVGAAAWRTPGPSAGTIELTLDRSAERPDDTHSPRTLVLTRDEASARWGRRPEAPGSGAASTVRRALRDVLWLSGFGAAALSFITWASLIGRAARRGSVVVIWMR